MKKLLIPGFLLLLVACKQSEPANTATVTETMATAATASPAVPTPTTTATIGTIGTTETTAPTVTATVAPTKPEAKRPVKKSSVTSTTATSTSAETAPPPAQAAPVSAPPPALATTTTPATEASPSAPSGNLAETGASVFKAKGCFVCHGANADGKTPMGRKNNIPDFHSAAVQNQSDADLAKILREGKSPLSAAAHKSKNLSDDQIKALIAWIRTLR